MDSRPSPSRIRRYPKATLFLIVFVCTIVLDFTGTGIYHLFKYGTIHKLANQHAMGERSPVFHHTLKASTHFTVQRWGHLQYAIATNSLGFKDRVVRDVPLTSPQYRLLFMGDSFTQGMGFGYDQTFVGLIATALSGEKVEVLNAAVASYSPLIYYKKTEHLLKTVGLRFDHLVVFLDISDIQDEAESYELRDGRVVWTGNRMTALRDFVYGYTTIPRNIWHLVVKVHAKLSDAPNARRTEEEKAYAINDHRSLWTIDPAVYEQYGARGLTEAQRHMTMLYDLITQYGIGMTLAVYPWPDQIAHQDVNSVQVVTWGTWAAERSIPFLNLFPDLVNPGTDPKQSIRRHYIPGDVHWNEAGHQLVADRFLVHWRTNPAYTARHAKPERQNVS